MSYISITTLSPVEAELIHPSLAEKATKSRNNKCFEIDSEHFDAAVELMNALRNLYEGEIILVSTVIS